MDAKDSVFVFVLLLLSLGLFGSLSLTYCVWNKQTEVASELQNELNTQSGVNNELKSELVDVQNELLEVQKRSELADIQNQLHSKLQGELQNQLHQLQNEVKIVLQAAMNSRVHLGTSEPSQDKGRLKRNVRQADEDTDTPSATELLTNALTEIIERKLVSYINCDKNEYNHTKCTLKPGPKGEPGPEGPTGEKGTKGEPGDMGHRGEPGDKGIKGQHGYPGYKGEKGVVGPQGPTGPTGPPGPPGIQGKDGPKGEQGPLGHKGDTGPRGPTGERGDKGDMGERGLKGDMGPPGPQGETGERGDMGQKGEPGDKGMKGNQGDKGEKGEQSVAGPPGVPTIAPTTAPTIVPTPTPTPPAPRECGGGQWRRVVFLNMTNTSHVCPVGLNLTSYSRRTCGRAHSGTLSCSSTTFSVGGSQYSRVCGRALAYRFVENVGFFGYHGYRQSIDAQYVSGLSLTHGAPGSRQHIWTFASGLFAGSQGGYNINKCPCDNGNTTYPSPPFVGNDYFCESTRTVSNWRVRHFFPNATLWDGQVCEGGGTCCKFNNPPWFTKNLTSSATDDIELRLCLSSGSSIANIALEQLELYVQ